MRKHALVPHDAVAIVCVVSAHLGLVLGLVAILATEVAGLLLHLLKLLRLLIVIDDG